MSTSQGRPTADASLGVTYRTIDVRTFFGDVVRTSLGHNFVEWVDVQLCSKYASAT